jgi:hypothetical protein
MAITKKIIVTCTFTVDVATSFEVNDKEATTVNQLEKMAREELEELQEELGLDELSPSISNIVIKFDGDR